MSNLSYKEASYQQRKSRTFEVVDQVMVYLRNERLRAGVQGKLWQRRYDLFWVSKKTNDNAYVIDLSDDMCISKTFNVTGLCDWSIKRHVHIQNIQYCRYFSLLSRSSFFMITQWRVLFKERMMRDTCSLMQINNSTWLVQSQRILRSTASWS